VLHLPAYLYRRLRADDEHILPPAQSLALRGRIEEPQVFGNTRSRR
jgi:hypothetical protein